MFEEDLAQLQEEFPEWLAAPSRDGNTPSYPRSALIHTAYLARAHLLRGELDEAVAAIRPRLGLLAHVQSPRARSYLRAVRSAMARRSRSQVVREFIEEFDRASSPT